MNQTLIIGVISTVVGLIGYMLGVIVPYPGRAFTVAGVMVGVTFLSIGLWSTSGGMRT